MQESEKRKFPRGPLQLPVSFTLHEITRKGYLTNLSAGGGLLYCYSLVPVNRHEPIEISFSLKNAPNDLALRCRVVRVTPFNYNPDYGNRPAVNYALGLEFLDVPEAQQRWIAWYVAQTLGRMKPE